MYQEMTFDEWLEKVKAACAQQGKQLPDADIELLELAYMECREENKSVEQFVEALK